MNKLPRPKIHEDGNARARAYQQRRREEREALELVSVRLVALADSPAPTAQQLEEELPERLRDAFRRVTQRRVCGVSLQKIAA